MRCIWCCWDVDWLKNQCCENLLSKSDIFAPCLIDFKEPLLKLQLVLFLFALNLKRLNTHTDHGCREAMPFAIHLVLGERNSKNVTWQDRLHHVHSLCSWHVVLTAEHVPSKRKIEPYCNQLDVCRSTGHFQKKRRKKNEKKMTSQISDGWNHWIPEVCNSVKTQKHNSSIDHSERNAWYKSGAILLIEVSVIWQKVHWNNWHSPDKKAQSLPNTHGALYGTRCELLMMFLSLVVIISCTYSFKNYLVNMT